MIEGSLDGGILTLRLAHGKASAFDRELCEDLRSKLESAAGAEGVKAVILTGKGSIFSAGVDLVRLLDGGVEETQSFVEALDSMLRALFLFPKPAVAAVNGHAIAGGAMLVFACDARLMSGGRIGVPELQVGVPFPPLALEIVRFAIPAPHLQPMVLFGHTIDAASALARGMVDEVVATDALEARAAEIARQLASVSPTAFRLTKRQLREPYLRAAGRIANASADEIDQEWSAPETHERIRTYLAKTVGKKS